MAKYLASSQIMWTTDPEEPELILKKARSADLSSPIQPQISEFVLVNTHLSQIDSEDHQVLWISNSINWNTAEDQPNRIELFPRDHLHQDLKDYLRGKRKNVRYFQGYLPQIAEQEIPKECLWLFWTVSTNNLP